MAHRLLRSFPSSARVFLSPFLALPAIALFASGPACSRFDNERSDNAPAPVPTQANLDGGDRIESLESRVRNLEAWRKQIDAAVVRLGQSQTADAQGVESLAGLKARVGSLEEKLDALAKNPPSDDVANGAALVALRAELESLRTDIGTVKSQLAAGADTDAKAALRVDDLEAWQDSTAALLAALDAAGIPGALAEIENWRASVTTVLGDIGAWRTQQDVRTTALEALAAQNSACIAQLSLVGDHTTPSSDAEKICASVREKINALAGLEGTTAELATQLKSMGDRVVELERITSARLARLRDLERALFVQKYGSERSLAPCGDRSAFTLTLNRAKVRTPFSVKAENGQTTSGALADGTFVYTPPRGATCSFAVSTFRRPLLKWEREILSLPAGTASLQVRKVCWTGAQTTKFCESVFERSVTP